MKNAIILAVIGTFTLATPVYAQSANDEKIKADVQALDKDNLALKKDQVILDRDRAAKAADKASGNTGKQAVDSVKIGAVQTAIEEKKLEKEIDEKILEHHKNEMIKESTAPADGN